MGMDFMNIAKKVQDMQKKAAVMQEELANLEISGQGAGGAVSVVCNGQGKFKSIKISSELLPGVDSDTIETLEDVISTAMKDADNKASEEMNRRMKSLTGGISIPGLKF